MNVGYEGQTQPGISDHPTDPTQAVVRTVDGQTAIVPKSMLPQNQPAQVAPIQSDLPPNGPVAQAPMAPPAPMAPIPMESQSQRQQMTEQKTVRPADVRKEQAAVAAMTNSITAQADAATAAAQNQAAALDAHTAELQQQVEDQRIKELDRQASLKQKQDDVNKVTQEFSQMTVDPKRAWGDASTGNKIAAIVGLALGAYGAVDGKNYAVDAVNKVIDRDIDAQKANIENKGKLVSMQRGALSDYMAVLGDERAAELSEKNRQLEIFKNKMEAIAQTSQSPIIKANAQKQIADINKIQSSNELERNARVEKNQATQQVQVGSMKPAAVRTPEASELKDITEQKNTINDLTNLKASLKKTEKELGPIEGPVKSFLQSHGIDVGGNFTQFNSQQKAALITMGRAMFGANVTENERKSIEEILPQVRDNPKLAETKLNELLKIRKAHFNETIKTVKDPMGALREMPATADDFEAKHSK